MKYFFKQDGWNQDDFIYAYSPACKEFPKFIQESDCLVNKEGLGLCQILRYQGQSRPQNGTFPFGGSGGL